MDKIWECKRCLHKASTKSNLLSHLRNKKICKVNADGGTAVDITEHIKELLTPDPTPKKYACQHCNRQFNTRQSKSRHLSTCKAKADTQVSKSNEVNVKNVDGDNHQVMNVDNQKEKQIEDLTQRVALLEELLKSKNIVNNNIGYVNNNSGTSYTQININVSPSTQVNNFGEEDLSHLSDDFLSYCLMNPKKGMTNLIQNIHYNKDLPENHNLRFKSDKKNLFEKFVDSEWRLCDASNTLDELIKKGYRILNAHYTDFFMNDMSLMDDEMKQVMMERFRFLGDTKCTDYYDVKRNLRVLIKDRTMYLLASPEAQQITN
jgi:hypothetical protein